MSMVPMQAYLSLGRCYHQLNLLPFFSEIECIILQPLYSALFLVGIPLWSFIRAIFSSCSRRNGNIIILNSSVACIWKLKYCRETWARAKLMKSCETFQWNISRRRKKNGYKIKFCLFVSREIKWKVIVIRSNDDNTDDNKLGQKTVPAWKWNCFVILYIYQWWHLPSGLYYYRLYHIADY